MAGEQLGVTRAIALIPEVVPGVGTESVKKANGRSGLSFGFPIPLFDQGQARVGRAVTELRRAQQEYYALGVRIRSAVRTVHERLQGAQDRALYYRDILLPLRERIVNETQLHYNAMQLGVFELLRAREQQIQTAVAYVDTLLDYWLARTDLEQLLSGRVPSPNGMPWAAGRAPLNWHAVAGNGLRPAPTSRERHWVTMLDINREEIPHGQEDFQTATCLGLTAATVGGVTALAAGAQAGTAADPQDAIDRRLERSRTEQTRPYWEASYSGGPAHVKPLPPGRPGKDYKPVVVPTGYTLPFKIVDGVKVFHLIAEEVEHDFDSGLRAQVLGLQRPREQHRDRGRRRRARAHLRDEPLARGHLRPLARHLSARTAWTASAA